MIKQFQSKDRQYEIDGLGVIHQTDAKPHEYNKDYIATYNTPEYQRDSELLCALRYGWVCGALDRVPQSMLDFGYGNGDFMRFAKQKTHFVYGYDISNYKVPEGCHKVNELIEADIYTFWDSLEHCPDISFIKDLKCRLIAISLPYCHLETKGNEWFDNWKHRKPDEHLHHFNISSLIRFFASNGWKIVSLGNFEDIIRRPVDQSQNILSACFVRFP